MNTQKIYDLLLNNEIEQAKQLLLQELTIKNSKHPKQEKAIQKLHKHIIKQTKDTRPNLAGAIYTDNDTFMCDGYILFVAYNEHIPALQTPNNPYTELNYNNLIKDTTNLNPCEFDPLDFATALADKSIENYTIDNTLFNKKWLKLLLDCFDNPKIYHTNKYILQIEQDNHKAIIMGIRSR